jgi:hypothetical protein
MAAKSGALSLFKEIAGERVKSLALLVVYEHTLSFVYRDSEASETGVNEIQTKSERTLIDAIKANTATIQYIYIHVDNIENVDNRLPIVCKFTQALVAETSVSDLCFWGCTLEENWVYAIIDAMRHNKTVLRLGLQNSRINEECTEYLLDALIPSVLKFVDFSNSTITKTTQNWVNMMLSSAGIPRRRIKIPSRRAISIELE